MALIVRGGFRNRSAEPLDARYFNNDGTSYINTAQVFDQIPESERHVGLTVNISGREYWFKNTTTLSPKFDDISEQAIADAKGYAEASAASAEEALETKEAVDVELVEISDKPYDAANYSGLARKRLLKNMVEGVNILTQAMMSDANTIYIIQYDYDLNGITLTIPANCILDFQGGSFKNFTSIVYNNTLIKADLYKIFEIGTIIDKGLYASCNGDFAATMSGTIRNSEVYPEWFGAVGDGVTDDSDAMQYAFNLSYTFTVKVKLAYVTYCIYTTLYLPERINIEGVTNKGNAVKHYSNIKFVKVRYAHRTKFNSTDTKTETVRLGKRVTAYIKNVYYLGSYSTPSYPSGPNGYPAVAEVLAFGDPYFMRKSYLFYGVYFAESDLEHLKVSSFGTFIYGRLANVSVLTRSFLSPIRTLILGKEVNVDNSTVCTWGGEPELGSTTSITYAAGENVNYPSGATFSGYKEEIAGYSVKQVALSDCTVSDNYINGLPLRSNVVLFAEIGTLKFVCNFVDFQGACFVGVNSFASSNISENEFDECMRILSNSYASPFLFQNNKIFLCNFYRCCNDSSLRIYPFKDVYDGTYSEQVLDSKNIPNSVLFFINEQVSDFYVRNNTFRNCEVAFDCANPCIRSYNIDIRDNGYYDVQTQFQGAWFQKDNTWALAVPEIDTLTITSAPTTIGNMTIYLNGLPTIVAVDPATETTPALVAAKIYAARISFLKDTLAYTAGTSIIQFTRKFLGTSTAPSFSTGTTGVVGSFVRTQIATSGSSGSYMSKEQMKNIWCEFFERYETDNYTLFPLPAIEPLYGLGWNSTRKVNETTIAFDKLTGTEYNIVNSQWNQKTIPNLTTTQRLALDTSLLSPLFRCFDTDLAQPLYMDGGEWIKWDGINVKTTGTFAGKPSVHLNDGFRYYDTDGSRYIKYTNSRWGNDDGSDFVHGVWIVGAEIVDSTVVETLYTSAEYAALGTKPTYNVGIVIKQDGYQFMYALSAPSKQIGYENKGSGVNLTKWGYSDTGYLNDFDGKTNSQLIASAMSGITGTSGVVGVPYIEYCLSYKVSTGDTNTWYAPSAGQINMIIQNLADFNACRVALDLAELTTSLYYATTDLRSIDYIITLNLEGASGNDGDAGYRPTLPVCHYYK